MVMMEPYVKEWYDHLEEGRLMALRCNRCNNYIFPPVAVCDNCYSTDLSWSEISGEGELVAFSLNIYPDPPFKEMAPYIYGLVKLKEGPSYSGTSWVWTRTRRRSCSTPFPSRSRPRRSRWKGTGRWPSGSRTDGLVNMLLSTAPPFSGAQDHG